MYPLLFSKVLKEKVWGGREFETFLNIPLAVGKTFGESWEVSAHPHGPSVVTQGPWSGRSLPELMQEEGEGLVGSDALKRFEGHFPLLIKYLDVHDRLSVQVHPDDAYALAHEGEFGKSECWYVVHASPDAKLILGVGEGVTREIFRDRVEQKAWNSLFREVAVQEGDFLHITPGTVHASLTGSVLLCEVQQNSDTTYRIYDFDRLENGAARPLHIEKALEVIDFDRRPTPTGASSREKQKREGCLWEPLVQDPHYGVALVSVEESWNDPATEGFHVHSILKGKGTVASSVGSWPVASGQTWLVPCGVETKWQGDLKILRSWA